MTSQGSLETALAWLRASTQEIDRLLEQLVLASSYTEDRAGVAEVVSRLWAALDGLPLTRERIASERFGPHLSFATVAPGAPVFLLGHTDTVFPKEIWTGWKVDGRVARGPGVFDMKGGLVVQVFAMKALHHAGELAHRPLRGLWVADEEVGSPESQPITGRLAAGSRSALDFESGRKNDAIVTARKGTGSVIVEATGVAAHAGNDHEKGKNAIWSIARFVDRAQRLTDYGRGVTLNVGRIEGGTSKNTVPAAARCDVDLRYLGPADGERLIAELEVAARESAVEGTTVIVRRGSTRPPLVRDEANAALARDYGACQRAAGLLDGESPLAGGGSDASTTGALGIPSIDGLGPRGGGYHTLEEWCDLDSIRPKAEALVRYLVSLG